MKTSVKWVILCSAMAVAAGLMLQHKAKEGETKFELSTKESVNSEINYEELKSYYKKKVARGRQQIALHQKWKQAYEEFERAQAEFDAVSVKVAVLRAEATRGLTQPEQWNQLTPEQIEKLEQANALEQATHQRLVESIELMRKVKVL